jgi:hypothetical protein
MTFTFSLSHSLKYSMKTKRDRTRKARDPNSIMQYLSPMPCLNSFLVQHVNYPENREPISEFYSSLVDHNHSHNLNCANCPFPDFSVILSCAPLHWPKVNDALICALLFFCQSRRFEHFVSLVRACWEPKVKTPARLVNTSQSKRRSTRTSLLRTIIQYNTKSTMSSTAR